MKLVTQLWITALMAGYSDQSPAAYISNLIESTTFAGDIVQGHEVPHLLEQYLATPANAVLALTYIEAYFYELDACDHDHFTSRMLRLPDEFAKYLSGVAAWMFCPA